MWQVVGIKWIDWLSTWSDNTNIVFECHSLVLIPDRKITQSPAVLHQQQKRFSCIPVPYAQACHFPPRGNYLWKRSRLKTTKAIYLLKISISLWVLKLIPLDFIFVIMTYQAAASNQIPHVTTSGIGCKKPGLNCWLTEHVTVDKRKVYSDQLKWNLLSTVSAEYIKSVLRSWPSPVDLLETIMALLKHKDFFFCLNSWIWNL